MLRFSLHELRIGSVNYALLPKLNAAQMETIRGNLAEKGFTVRVGSQMFAKKDPISIHIDASGICWSRSDMSDYLVPIIPALLESRKVEVPTEALRGRYFGIIQRGPQATLRFRPRLEGGSVWKELRRAGLCALGPDEHSVLGFLIDHSKGPCSLVTDFPTPTSKSSVVRGRRIFESEISPSAARSTLASVSVHGPRNSYLPKDGVLRFRSFRPPSKAEYETLFEHLGEWCYLRPT